MLLAPFHLRGTWTPTTSPTHRFHRYRTDRKPLGSPASAPPSARTWQPWTCLPPSLVLQRLLRVFGTPVETNKIKQEEGWTERMKRRHREVEKGKAKSNVFLSLSFAPLRSIYAAFWTPQPGAAGLSIISKSTLLQSTADSWMTTNQAKPFPSTTSLWPSPARNPASASTP